MLDLTPAGVMRAPEPIPAALAGRNTPRMPARKPHLILRSRTRGRERWYADQVEGRPRLAAAVEMVLRSEEGIEAVRANPITGKVLIQYRPESISEPVEKMLLRAVEAGPLSREEFAALQAVEPKEGSCASHLITTEIACSLSHLFIFGGFCPLGLAATGVLLLLHRNSAIHTHR